MNNLTDVIVIGAGPTGLTAAIEAVRHGLSVRIIDKNEAHTIYSKALVAHSRTLEIFQDIGLIEEILASGQIFKALNIYSQNKQMTRIVFEELDWKDAPYPFWLSIPQAETERCLETKLAQLGIQIERQTEAIWLEQRPDSVSVTLRRSDGTRDTVDASWVIGCDGASSPTRKLLHLGFEGHAENKVFILADVEVVSDLPTGEGYNVLSPDGIVLVVPMPEPYRRRLIFYMPALKPDQVPEMTLASLQTLLDKRTHFCIKLTGVNWTSQFSVKHFIASRHRQGRVFLAGDAAHIHSPVGGQGMNSGIQDAYNLMWKLALVHHGQAKPILLESYETERHQVAKNLIKHVSTATQVITTNHPIVRSLLDRLGHLLINIKSVQNQLGRNVSMLDLHYPNSQVIQAAKLEFPFMRVSGRGPKPGERAPNLVIQTRVQHGPQSLFDYFGGVHHTLVMFMGIKTQISIATLKEIAGDVHRRYQAPIHSVIMANEAYGPAENEEAPLIILDINNTLHQTYGALHPSVYVIRPDQYIAYRDLHLKPNALIGYLDRVLI